MKFLKRIFKIGEAEANAALDNYENPINMTEQGIRDLKDDLNAAMEALAKVKSMVIRAKTDAEEQANGASNFENKALLLLQKAEKGEMDATEADRLATEALVKKQELDAACAKSLEEQAKNEEHAENLQANIAKMKSAISKWENELRTLKARSEVSEATKNINKQLAGMDTQGTVAMLERMKSKVVEQEALSSAYADIAKESKSVEEEINQALGGEKEAAKDALAKLKAKIQESNKNNS